jgi:hypothetical protein
MEKVQKYNQIDIKAIFMELQKEMIAGLLTSSESIPHSGTKGSATEVRWIEWLNDYLPERYNCNSAFIIDSHGSLSDQIDIVIYDRQYSPFLFNHDGALYIPAESVYAVFEIKQTLNKDNIKYAGNKAASVRKLNRTSVEIPHAGGTYPPKPPIPILAGILATDSEWNPPLGKPFEEIIESLSELERLDIGCSIQNGSFDINYKDDKIDIERSGEDEALILFFLKLLYHLQGVGTVSAMDISEYIKAFK